MGYVRYDASARRPLPHRGRGRRYPGRACIDELAGAVEAGRSEVERQVGAGANESTRSARALKAVEVEHGACSPLLISGTRAPAWRAGPSGPRAGESISS